MKNAVIVDASVFISSFISNDGSNYVSRRFFEEVKKKKGTVFIPIVTFFEILHGFYRNTRNLKKVDDIYENMIDWNISKGLRIINMEASFLAYFTSFHHLFDVKTGDAVLAVAAHRFKYPLISLDKKLLDKAKKHITVFTPEEYITRPN